MGRHKLQFKNRPKDLKKYQLLIITLGDNTMVTFVGPSQLLPNTGAFLQDISFTKPKPLTAKQLKVLQDLMG